ncbi:MAG: hypothetical protein ACRC63_01905, partial [Metamycoplasmataceae bacterium]
GLEVKIITDDNDNTMKTIKLTVNEGYMILFGGQYINTISSYEFEAVLILNINVKWPTDSITSVDINETNRSTIETLSRLFTSTSDINQNIIDAGLRISISDAGTTDEQEIKILNLHINKGYRIFSEGIYYSTIFSSGHFSVDDEIVMDFTLKSLIGQTILSSEIYDQDKLKSIETLSKMFEGIEEKHLRWMEEISFHPGGNSDYYVRLKAKEGYSFKLTSAMIITSHTFQVVQEIKE